MRDKKQKCSHISHMAKIEQLKAENERLLRENDYMREYIRTHEYKQTCRIEAKKDIHFNPLLNLKAYQTYESSLFEELKIRLVDYMIAGGVVIKSRTDDHISLTVEAVPFSPESSLKGVKKA